jgi:hypothetical protein
MTTYSPVPPQHILDSPEGAPVVVVAYSLGATITSTGCRSSTSPFAAPTRSVMIHLRPVAQGRADR